jgi:hypothetical protein
LNAERKPKELLFTECIELAQLKVKFLMDVAEKTGQTALIADYVAYAEMYYSLLKDLKEKGVLAEDWKEETAKGYGRQML